MKIKNRFVRETVLNLPGFRGSLFSNRVRFDGTSALASLTAMTVVGIADAAAKDGLAWVQDKLRKRREARNALRREDEVRSKSSTGEAAHG